MRRLARERCDRLAALPIDGQIESLNVSVAAGIALWTLTRAAKA
jgi:23S rRNA (guanosine2251-2'-O)-methyltransferase